MKCFYHSADLDGHCSGAIVKMAEPECEMIGIDYGQPFPWESIEPGERVVMVDFSLQPFEDMIRLDALVDLVWIDHHKSAIEDAVASGRLINGTQVEGLGACALVWEWCFPGTPMPRAVELLARYDVWDHSHPDTLPFQYGMRLERATVPGVSVWYELMHPRWFARELLDTICGRGRVVQRYEELQNEKYARACAFEATVDGLRVIAMNRQLGNSKVFDSVWNPARHDAMCTFGWRGGQWHVSLYSDREDVDVLAVAKARGGGGHKDAAGFQCRVLPAGLGVLSEMTPAHAAIARRINAALFDAVDTDDDEMEG